ncbi:GTP-binding protein [Methanococcoides methylutens]|uniref:Putative metal chaperone, involved in Zn homeostasis, GTPase of COG0523 family n=1 Tax=Methanococcoides methylutens MM1 TaxID=1434104 RepID=A0A0E3SQN1_METMT|nr:GTP-binding protein [Methanococcoides methylutens]AKB85006.1 Putative metal chaperone, involved in Zn homeostasis, GTPase of COG0523 family [Methanococcoides methylutens MM1]
MLTLVVGGFLGSGKTTTIINTGKYLVDKGHKVAIIVNEIGEIGIDGDIINKFGFDTKEITNGCICCSLKMGLRSTVITLYNSYNPDILIIEPTGIAFPNVIKREIELMDLGEGAEIAPLVTLIDGSRFKHLLKEMKHFSTRQIEDAEILAINKVDLMDNLQIPIIEESVQQLNKKAKVIRISGNDRDEKFYDFMDMVFPEEIRDGSSGAEIQQTKAAEAGKSSIAPANGISLVSKEHMDLIKDEQETESSIDASGVATYAAEYKIKDGTDIERSKMIARDIMTKIKAEVMKHSPEFIGHIKMFLDSDADTVKMNVTAYFEEPQLELIETGENETFKLKILSAISNMEKDDLMKIVDNFATDVFNSYGIAIEKLDPHHHHEHGHSHHH